MVPYKIIETSVPRESHVLDRRVDLPRLTKAPFGTPEHDKWVEQNWWMIDYAVHHFNKERAMELASELYSFFEANSEDERIHLIVKELWELYIKQENRTPLEMWQSMAYQMPDDIGGGYRTKRWITTYLSEKYKGRVLEAMCGFNSYFSPDDNRTVVALDYCREALERYSYSDRLRICSNLNLVTSESHLECFSGKFDTISICFGFRYLDHPVEVFAEFLRHLNPGGTLSFVENPYSGYVEICRRAFSPKVCEKFLREAGFTTISICRMSIQTVALEQDYYYHVEASW